MDDENIGPDCPKYRFPGERTRNGTIIEFRKANLLFNVHRLRCPIDDVIVVEGFLSVFWLWQHGFENVVSIMGSACSDVQLALILKLVKKEGRVVLFTDGDDAGDRGVRDLMPHLSKHRTIEWVRAGDGRQPTDCTGRELRDLLGVPSISAEKSGTSTRSTVADPSQTRNDRAGESMAAGT